MSFLKKEEFCVCIFLFGGIIGYIRYILPDRIQKCLNKQVLVDKQSNIPFWSDRMIDTYKSPCLLNYHTFLKKQSLYPLTKFMLLQKPEHSNFKNIKSLYLKYPSICSPLQEKTYQYHLLFICYIFGMVKILSLKKHSNFVLSI
jgi:hypothetical protein